MILVFIIHLFVVYCFFTIFASENISFLSIAKQLLMSIFREIKKTHLLESAEPLSANGSTCLCYKVKVYDQWQFVKRLKPELQNDQRYIALFRKEFEVGSKLDHPNLVSYNKIEESDEGLMMFLDYVEGRTLAEVLIKEPDYFSSNNRLSRFSIQVLSALDYMHSHQVLHLDLKPENIMITRINEDVKILDLGFCRTDCFTSTEGMTEGFNAPEQASTDKLVDTRTDLYAFGKILEKIEQSQEKKLPQIFHQLMLRCIEENPDKRPQSATDALKSLQKHNKLIQKICLSTLFFIALFVGLWSYEPTREALKYQLRHLNFRGYQWSDHGCRMRIISDKEMTCEVVGFDPNESCISNLLVPASSDFNGHTYHVITIADTAMIDNQLIKTVFLPEGIKRVGERAFNHCHFIETLNLPSSLTQFGDGCFSLCSGLKNLHLPDSIKVLAARSFHGCASLTSIEIPEGVTRIGTDCFVADSSLVLVSLPSTLEIIDRGVFFLCKSIPSITLPASLNSIGDYAFYDCDALKEVICMAETPPSILDCFSNYDITLKVPEKTIEKYREHPIWGRFNVIDL